MSSVVNVIVTATNRTASVFAAMQRQMIRGIQNIQSRFVRLTGSSNAFVRALGHVGNAGGAAAQLFVKSFGPIAIAGISSIAAELAAILIAALGAAVALGLGASVFALGIFAAAKSPPVKSAFKKFKETAAEAFKDLGGPFQAPIVRALDAAGKTAQKIAPQVFKMVAQAAPHLDQVNAGFLGMVERAMPGIGDALEKAALPILDKLGEKLPQLGTALKQFFQLIADAGPQLTRVFAFLLDALNVVIVVLGGTINFAAKYFAYFIDMFQAIGRIAVEAWNGIKGAAEAAWNFIKEGISGLRSVVVSVFSAITSAVLNFFGMIIDSAAKAFGWIPGLGPKLQAAAADFNNFKNQVNAALAAIDKHVTITIERKFIGGTLGGAGGYRGLASGGIVGAASGGSRSRLTWVGERGRELVDFSQGRVYNHGQSERMAAGMGGPTGSVNIYVQPGPNSRGNPLVTAVLSLIRSGDLSLVADPRSGRVRAAT